MYKYVRELWKNPKENLGQVWQQRLLESKKLKPWCKQKDKFLIIDCWDNFEYFQMNPTGKIERPVKPIPVRLFEVKLEKLSAAQTLGNNKLIQDTIQKLKDDIAKLPQNNVVILDNKNTLDTLDEQFWARLTEDKQLFLQKDIAPLMRTRTGEDYKAMSFELKVIQYSIAKLEQGEAQEKK